MTTSSAKFLSVTAAPLPKRGISEEACRKLGYGLAEEGGRTVQVAEFRDEKGRVVAQKIKNPPGSKDKYRWVGMKPEHCVFFGRHAWKEGGRMVVVTEGELDALSVSDSGDNKWPVVSINGGAGSAKPPKDPVAVQEFKRNLEWLESFEKVIIMFDMDDQGQEIAPLCAELLSPGKAFIADLPLKDASDMLQAGRGDELVTAKFQAKPYRPDGIRTGQELLEILLRPIPEGLPFPHTGLQAKLQGLRPKEITLFGGGPGSGKSEICRHFATWFAREHGLKVGYVALEESVQETILSILSPIVGENLRIAGPIDSDAAAGEAYTEGWGQQSERLAALCQEHIGDQWAFYDHWGSIASDRLLSKIGWLAKGWGADLIVFDHITIAQSGLETDDERKGLDILITKLRALIMQTEAHLFVVSHLKQPGGTGEGWDEGAEIRMHHFRGTSQLAGIANNIIGCERNQQAEDETERNRLALRVVKNRTASRTGLAGHYQYDVDTRRFAEVCGGDEVDW